MTLVCPCCLGALNKTEAALICFSCNGLYPLRDGVPVMLVRDLNWDKKQDEITGEIEFNTKTISPETHNKRNDFLNANSQTLLLQSGTDLRHKSVLLVGASMAEAQCFAPLAGETTALDIVPELTVAYRDASRQIGLPVSWVCGDGECLPFASESFDVVIIRQALHHMLRYHSAISEFFRVARVRGRILVIEEPYSPPDLDHPAVTAQPDAFDLYDGTTLGELRRMLWYGGGWRGAWRGLRGARRDTRPPETLRPDSDYVPPVAGNTESLLADKYHRFSAVEMIIALRMHTDRLQLIWPEEIGWTDDSGPEITFRSGTNSAASLPLIDRLSVPTTFSAIADKTSPTIALRSRADLLPAQRLAQGSV
jgi:uncharacterized protein YbaR (Trm112 family)